MEGDFPFRHDDEIGFVAAKNGRTVQRHLASGLRYHLFTDDRGARVNAPTERTPPRVDLVTIGCSFAWGHGVENEDTFTEQLRRRVGVTVANFALAGYGTVHSLLLLRRELDLRPRVVVYGFIDDHLQRNLSPCAPSYAPFCAPVAHVVLDGDGRPAIGPPNPGLFTVDLNRRFYEEITMTDGFYVRDVLWRARVDLLRLRQTRAIEFPHDARSQSTSVRWLIGRLVEETRRAGAALVIVRIPGLEPGAAAPPPPALTDATAAHDVILVDLTPAVGRYWASDPNGSLHLTGDGHPNRTAHALIAAELERELRSRRLLE